LLDEVDNLPGPHGLITQRRGGTSGRNQVSGGGKERRHKRQGQGVD
jgi:hypothetical protein